jgi:hypothetical protein
MRILPKKCDNLYGKGECRELLEVPICRFMPVLQTGVVRSCRSIQPKLQERLPAILRFAALYAQAIAASFVRYAGVWAYARAASFGHLPAG